MNKLNVDFFQVDNEIEYKTLAILKGDYFTSYLKSIKCYEKCFTDFAHQVIKPTNLALDIGANLGYHTVTMGELVGNDGCVLSFEPQRIIFQQLNCNVFLNGLGNVYTFNHAVGENKGEVFIEEPNYYNDTEWPNVTNIGDTSINTENRGIPVHQTTIDSLNLKKLNFIKLDIQGSELGCLKGACQTIVKFKPYMFIEIEERQLNKFGLTANELITYIKNLGYKLFRIYVDFKVTDDYICIPLENNTFDVSKYPYTVSEV
jgi:FkbM family methyltransferase